MTTTIDDEVNDAIKNLSKVASNNHSSEFDYKQKKRMQDLADQFLEKLDKVIISKEIK